MLAMGLIPTLFSAWARLAGVSSRVSVPSLLTIHSRNVSKATLRAQEKRSTQSNNGTDDPSVRLTVEQLTKIDSMRCDNIFMAEGLCLRREARQFCRNHEVIASVMPQRRTERVLTGSMKVDPTTITIDGQKPEACGIPLHIALHKPAGYVCSHSMEEGKTVYELLPSEWQLRNPVLSTVGRLDKMATGLILLTQNGQLNNRLTSPRKGVPKEYVVSLEMPLSDKLTEVKAFASGKLELVDGSLARPAVLIPHKDPAMRHVAKVVLAEGRHHQLRRMFAAVGHNVVGIHRVAFGGLRLPQLGLEEGKWRLLTPAELQVLLDSSATAVTLPPERKIPGAQRVRVKQEHPRGGAADSLGWDREVDEELEEQGADDDEDEEHKERSASTERRRPRLERSLDDLQQLLDAGGDESDDGVGNSSDEAAGRASRLGRGRQRRKHSA